MGTHTEQKAKMHAKGTNISSSLAAHPEHTQLPLVVKLIQLALVDRSDTQLTLDGGNEGRSLEQSTGEGLEGTRKLRLASGQLVVQADHAYVLLSGTLLRLDEASGAIDADDEAAGDLWVESAAVTSLLNSINC